MLFAIEISDSVWLAIIGLVALAINRYFSLQDAKVVAAKVEAVRVQQEAAEKKVDTVATNLAYANNTQSDQMAGLATLVQERHE